MKKPAFVFLILFGSSIARGLNSGEAAPGGKFDMRSIESNRKIGLTTIKKEGDKSRVEFESMKLKRGKYSLYVSRYCQDFEKKKIKNKRQRRQLGKPILEFTTLSGDLWSENVLPEKELPVFTEDRPFVFILAKKEKSGRQIVATSLCAKMNPPSTEITQTQWMPESSAGN